MNIDLNLLTFGSPAAERDINQGLKDYFVESNSFEYIYNGNKYILLGNRGSGKSAIFKIISERENENGNIIIELSPEDYSYEILNDILKSEKEGSWNKQGAYSAAWKYLIYILIMKEITKNGSKLKIGSSSRVYSYLRDNHIGQQNNPIAVLISYLKRIEGFKVGKYEASMKTKELSRLYKLEEINNLIPDIIELLKKKRITVLVDELDKGWDASENAKNFVVGLFNAAVSMNEQSPNLRVLVSLRKELYDNIPTLYEDAQKVRDVIEVINWSEDSLKELITNRIKYVYKDLKNLSIDEIWNSIFSDSIDYRNAKSFNYMIDRTLLRPREIIQFCADSVEIAKKTKNFPINYFEISQAEANYSEQRTKDISAEYKFQYPGFNKIFEIFRGKSYTLEKDELENICLAVSLGEYKVPDVAKWVLEQEPEYIIDAFWRVGFLKAQAVGKVKGTLRSGSRYASYNQLPNLNLRNIQRFHVHPMFRTYLGMKEAKGVI